MYYEKAAGWTKESEMTYTVADLIKGRPDPVTTQREESVLKALSLMIEHDFSQLPVVGPDFRPLGMVSYEGILRGIRNFRASLNDLHVRDVMQNSPTFNLEDDFFDLLAQLKLTNAVLILDETYTLTGIVTSYDLTEYFRSRAENLMHIEDIEAAIKEFILLAHTGENGLVDDGKLAEAISKHTPQEKDSNGVIKKKTFDSLSLGHYINLLTAKTTWDFLAPIFKISRDILQKMLDDVRITRNELAHFRSEISVEQSDQLRFCAYWLARCQEEYQEHLEAIRRARNEEILKSFETKASGQTVRQGSADEGQIGRPSDEQIESQATEGTAGIQVIAEQPQPGESRYAPLADWLQSQPGEVDQVQLSFTEIEKIIGGSLPDSARTHRAWWSNDAESHPQGKIWIDAGWRTTFVNLTEQRVTFTRIRERARLYRLLQQINI